MDVNEAKRFLSLEEESRLKRNVADQMLDIVVLKDVISKMVMPVAKREPTIYPIQ